MSFKALRHLKETPEQQAKAAEGFEARLDRNVRLCRAANYPARRLATRHADRRRVCGQKRQADTHKLPHRRVH